MKRALVTGGCGFIGSNLTKKLVSEGWTVDIVDNMINGHIELLEGLSVRHLPNSSFLSLYNQQVKNRNQNEVVFIEDDFASSGIIRNICDKNYDIVFHQAAIPRVSYSVENPSETTDTNISGTVRLFEACIDNVNRVVFASSSSVYGGADILPTSEDYMKDPKSPYAWQKSAIEDYAKICWQLYNLDIICLRYFNVFGPGQYGDSPYSTAVSAWCHAIKNDLELRSDGDGTQSRDMSYIDNVVSANILAATSNKNFRGECYNIACNDKVSNNEILNYFKTKFDLKIKNAPWRPGDVMHTKADIKKAQKDLGYKVLVSFWEGIERTLDWWKINK